MTFTIHAATAPPRAQAEPKVFGVGSDGVRRPLLLGDTLCAFAQPAVAPADGPIDRWAVHFKEESNGEVTLVSEAGLGGGGRGGGDGGGVGDCHPALQSLPFGTYSSQFMPQAPDALDPMARHVAEHPDYLLGPRPPVRLCCVVIPIARDGSVLVTQRATRQRGGCFNNLWVFPGGHADSGETLEQAALRELREETGLHVPAAAPLRKLCVWQAQVVGQRRQYCILMYALQLDVEASLVPLRLQACEVAAAGWLPKAHLHLALLPKGGGETGGEGCGEGGVGDGGGKGGEGGATFQAIMLGNGGGGEGEPALAAEPEAPGAVVTLSVQRLQYLAAASSDQVKCRILDPLQLATRYTRLLATPIKHNTI